MIRGAHLASAIIKNKCWEGLDRILENVLSRELKEGTKAVQLLELDIRGHR